MSTTVRVIRMLNNDSQEKLAEYLGLDRTTITRKENGTIPFSIEEIQKISAKYDVSIESLVNPELAKKKVLKVLK